MISWEYPAKKEYPMTECEMIATVLLVGLVTMTVWLTVVLRNHRGER